jgi:predicted Zn-dependent protease
MSRLENIKKIVEQQPNDPFARYGLAMELKNGGQLADADAQFVELERRHPNYVPQFLMHANVLKELGRVPDAKSCLERGMVAAQEARNSHALGEMQALLDELS